LSDFYRLLQCNLGRLRRAHDLLLQTICEGEVALATVADPYRVHDAPNWIGDLDGLTAVTWAPTLGAFSALIDRGSGYVAVEWAGIAVVAVYVSPNSGLAAFGDFLDDVGECIKRCCPRQVLVLGDQCPLDAVGELRNEHQRKMADRLRCRTRTPAGKQGYGEHLRGVEGVLRG
jgi:hypothetical protein